MSEKEESMTDDEIQRALGRIEGKLDAWAKRLDEHSEAGRLVEARVSSLEQSRSWLVGGAAAVAAVVASIMQLFLGNQK